MVADVKCILENRKKLNLKSTFILQLVYDFRGIKFKLLTDYVKSCNSLCMLFA